ncbi:hypothetical protein [Sphingobacterium spiritivorum]|uniref:hypothetical protein n=1 Tax=Sphingobacterium spiritivorum TaxID=258 RepID=UPI00191A8F4C|nr:hypothetical protein [Sphingobacterium spiritivorum]QQT24873.1 hypothetical protein I6J02_14190 [Sphingobacterium spiritivorum]
MIFKIFSKNSQDQIYVIRTEGDIRVDSINGFINIIDDRELFQNYSFEDKISILAEYLTFVGDIKTSNKFYKFRPSVGEQITRGLEVQIEALFSFSMMLINGYPSIRPIL